MNVTKQAKSIVTELLTAVWGNTRTAQGRDTDTWCTYGRWTSESRIEVSVTLIGVTAETELSKAIREAFEATPGGKIVVYGLTDCSGREQSDWRISAAIPASKKK